MTTHFKVYFQKAPPGLEKHKGIKLRRKSGSIWFGGYVLIFGFEPKY